MYIPKHFEENREEEIKRIIENFPLAILVANTKNGIVANHIPLLLYKLSNAKKILIGHIAKANNLHEELNDNDNVMVIFKSEDAYISPNWYPTRNKKKEHVPTWNYQSVHLYGNISFKHEKKFLLKTVKDLTNIFEKDKKYLNGILKNGAEQASYIARKTMSKVYRKVGLVPYPR